MIFRWREERRGRAVGREKADKCEATRGSRAGIPRTLYPALAKAGMVLRNWPRLAPKPWTRTTGGPAPVTCHRHHQDSMCPLMG